MTKMATIPENYNNIRAGIVELLKTARSSAARNVNTLMTATYWEIGRRIVQSEQAGERGLSMANCSSSDWPKTYRHHSAEALDRAISPR